MSNTSYFLLRRLHSLFGVIPLGIFLFNHLLTNSMGFFGTEAFEHKVALIHMLGPVLPLVEAVMIFIPLSIHIALGAYIATTSKPETGLKYGRNWAYNFQRYSGWFALLFIAYHVIHLRFLHDMHAVPFSFVLANMFTSAWAPVLIPLYLIGGLSVVFHFANGLCTFCMTWGITTGPKSQKGMAVVGAGIGAVLTIMLFASVIGFTREGFSYRKMDEKQREALVESIHSHQHELDPDKALAYLNENFGG